MREKGSGATCGDIRLRNSDPISDPNCILDGTFGPETPVNKPFLVWIGAGDRSRTYDLRITNALLYQLSYTGLGGG